MVVRTLGIVAALVSVAHAVPDKFTHTANVHVEVKSLDKLKPPPRRDDPAAPQITAEGYLKIEEVLGEVHEDQILILKDLLANTPAADVADRADLLFRIGEMYAKQYRLHHLRAVEASIKKQDDKALKARASKSLVEAVRAYRQLTDDESLRGYAKMDTALFYYAYSLQLGGYIKESRSVFDKLLKDYPKSKFVPEAHLAFAEYFFEVGQLADAEARYKMVAKFPTSGVYWYAVYKLGWVQLNQNKAQEALETFYTVAQGTKKDPKAQLYRAAKHDFVRAYAEVGRADKAYPAFQRVDAKDGFDMLGILADLYQAQGKADKAIFVYREMLHERPTSPLACVWEYNVARGMMTVGTAPDRVHEIEELVRLYSAVKTKLPKAEAIECHDNAAEMSGQLARAYHQEAVKTKSVELAGYAERLYRAYLAAFKDAPDFGETQYFHAELAWTRADLQPDRRLAVENWKDAAAAFTEVAEAGKVDAKLVQVAADAAMLAMMKALAVDPRVREQPIADAAYDAVAKPRPIPEAEQRLLAAYDGYLAHVKDPKDSERVDVQFHKANLLRRYDHFAEAIPVFTDILTHHRDHEAAEFSAQLLLDSYNRLHEFGKLAALVEELAADPWLKDKEVLRTTVEKLRLQVVRKDAEHLENEAKQTHVLATFVACGNRFLDAYNQKIDAGDADELLYNAGVCYEEGKSMTAAKLVYENLGKLFPKSKVTAHAVVRLGNVYAMTAFYREASEKFEEYATKYAGEQDAYDALSGAVNFRKGIGDDPQAIADTQTFLRMFGAKKPVEAANAFWSLTAIYEKQNDSDAVIRHLRAYIAKYGATGGHDRLVIAWSKLGQTLWEKSCPAKTTDGSCIKVQREAVLDKRIRALRVAEIPKQCGDDTKVKLTVIPRDEGAARAAMAAFATAIKEYKPSADPAAKYFFALAKLGVTERQYEQYLALPLPANLDFDHRKPMIEAQSHKRFETWFKAKLEVGTALKKQYEDIVHLGDGATAIAAGSRLGQVLQGFSGQLFRAEIPANLRVGPYAEDVTQSYCDELTKLADPLEHDAQVAYQLCLDTSKRLGWFSESSRVCERELGQLDPSHWPTAREVRHEPEQISRIDDVEGVPL